MENYECSTSKHEKRVNMLHVCKQNKIFNISFSLLIISTYFCLSIGLTFYQRWFLQKSSFPLTVVMLHLALKFLLAMLCRYIWEYWTMRQRIRLNWRNIVYKMGPIGFASALDIAFSNWGIELITVSLYTMTKSTAIIFILMFSLLLKLEQMSYSLLVIVFMIAGGLLMFTYKATQFDALGFFLVLFASFSSGLRWTLAQFVMQKSDLGLQHPIDMIYFVQPVMFLTVLLLVSGFEGKTLFTKIIESPEYSLQFYKFIALITFGGVIAFFMEITEYLVVSRLSSLTFSIAGIIKEMCTLTLAFEWSGDDLSPINAVGLLLCFGGIGSHIIHKTMTMRTHSNVIITTKNKQEFDDSVKFLINNTSSDDDFEDDDSTVVFDVLNSRDR